MDSGINPDTGMGSEDSDNEMCVPLASLAVDGQTPAEGDTVQIEARVTRVENDMAYVVPVDQGTDSAVEDNSEPQFSDNGEYAG